MGDSSARTVVNAPNRVKWRGRASVKPHGREPPQVAVFAAVVAGSRQNGPRMQSSAATLRLAVLPRAGLLADAALIVGGAGFVALAAQVSIHLGFTPVPITGQTFAVVLVGASLGTI